VINRAIIHVTGQSGAGKTTLVEAVLEALQYETILCVFAMSDEKRKQPHESAPKNDPHLQRYRNAGAADSVLYRFKKIKRDIIDAFFEAEAMSHYSSTVLIEGASPLSYYDLTTFVARPLPADESLLVAAIRDNRAEHERQLAEAEAIARDPRRILGILGAEFSSKVDSYIAKNSAFFSTLREELLNKVEELRSLPLPDPTPYWTLSESYRGIEDAGLVVVNIRDEAERERAEALVADVHRLRSDRKVFDDVLGLRYHRTPVTAVVANLGDPKDAGRKKAIARLKRAVKQGRES
jgi:molybdopterin-guanine dinucleotide biosynthesis protein